MVHREDVVECEGQNTVVFAGRERGEFVRDGVTVPLAIRTTRVFQYFGGELGWRQVHHPSMTSRRWRGTGGRFSGSERCPGGVTFSHL